MIMRMSTIPAILTDGYSKQKYPFLTIEQKCISRNITIKAPAEHIIKEGWYGKAKGLNRKVWERGFINEGKKYTVSIEKYEFGVFDYQK